MRLAPVLLSLAAALTAVSPAQAEKYSPFKSPRDSIVTAVKTIAIDAIKGVPADHPRRAAILAEFDSLIAAELRSAGFQIVSSSAVDSLVKAERDSLGGLFDPATGEPDTVKTKALHERVLDKLRSGFQADAWLHASFQVTTAAFSGGTARWMGASETIRPKGVLGFLGSGQVSGTVSALTLFVLIEDLGGRNLYFDMGGLQLLRKYNLRHDFVEVSKDSLWANPKRNTNAVHLAIGALTEPPEKSKSKEKKKD